MGAWGTGVKENDIALDFLNKLIKKGFGMAQDNEEFLLLGNMIVIFGYILNTEELSKLSKIIQYEINDIESWTKDCRTERLKVLNELLENLRKLCF